MSKVSTKPSFQGNGRFSDSTPGRETLYNGKFGLMNICRYPSPKTLDNTTALHGRIDRGFTWLNLHGWTSLRHWLDRGLPRLRRIGAGRGREIAYPKHGCIVITSFEHPWVYFWLARKLMLREL
jgi:hypothetical protein